MSIIQGIAKGGSTSFYDFPIEQSLRFDGSSYLSKSFSGSGVSIFTYSLWVKRSDISDGSLLSHHATSTEYDVIYFVGNNIRYVSTDNGSSLNTDYRTASVYRDTSSWYHIVIQNDTSSTPIIKIYVNGVETSYSSTTSTTRITNFTQTSTNLDMQIGVWGSSNFFNGYLANIQLIDGQALDASYFGETKDDIWIPKTFDGTSSTGGSTVSTDYGTNGFLLDFSSISGTTINDTAPIDTNHSSANNWTATGF